QFGSSFTPNERPSTLVWVPREGSRPFMIFSLPCIFLLKNRFATAHAVRRAIRKASIHVILQEIASRDEFLGSVHVHRPNLVLAGEEGLPDLPLAELLEFSRSSEPVVSVVVLGEDQAIDTALKTIREGASDYLRPSQLDRLPSVLER